MPSPEEWYEESRRILARERGIEDSFVPSLSVARRVLEEARYDVADESKTDRPGKDSTAEA